MLQRVPLLLFLTVCIHLNAQPYKNKIQHLYEQAEVSYTSNPVKSLQKIDSIVNLEPQSKYALQALLLKCEILRLKKQLPEALQTLQQVKQLNEQEEGKTYAAHILLVKGAIYKDLSNDSAHVFLDQAWRIVSLRKDSLLMAQTLTLQAYLQMEKGNYLAAMDNLNKINTILPANDFRNRLKLFTNQSHTFNSVGLYNRTVALSTKMVNLIYTLPDEQINSDLLPTFGNICDAYLKLNKADSALYYADMAIRLLKGIPANSAFHVTLAQIYLDLGNPTEALTYLKKYNVTPEFTVYYLYKQNALLKVYQKLGDTSNANLIAKEIIKRIPNIPRISVMMNLYQIAESAYLQINNQYMAYQYSKKYFEAYQQVYNQKKLSDLLDKDFEETLKQQRKQSELEANLLRSAVTFQQQQKWWLISVSFLLVVVIVLLWFRFRSAKHFNRKLNELVKERTLEITIKNEQLNEYAFINAHKLRAPLARIMGLLHIYKLKDSQLHISTLVDLMEQETQSLDTIVRSITEALQEKRILNRNDL